MTAQLTHDTPHTSSIDAKASPAIGSGTSYLPAHEPGGIDDADVWLMATVAMIPIASVVVLVGVYYGTNESSSRSILFGALTAVLFFVVFYAIYLATHFNTAQHASVDTYNDLCERMGYVASIPLSDWPQDASLHAAAGAAYRSVQSYGQDFQIIRRKKGLHWVLGKGYIDLLKLVHRAEEALIMYEPVDLVVLDGLKDFGRISESTIPSADHLLARVRLALAELMPSALRYLPAEAPAVGSAGHGGANGVATVPAGGDRTQDGPPTSSSSLEPAAVSGQTQARVILRDVRYVVDDFRDSRRARLIDARNDLVARMFLTALATCLLLVFIVIGHPPREALLTGAVLYAVGAIVGLFSRLYADLGTDGFAADYGISYVRLFQTFLVSGLAAVAGVYVAVALPVALNNTVLRPLEADVSASAANSAPSTATPAAAALLGAPATLGASGGTGSPLVAATPPTAPSAAPAGVSPAPGVTSASPAVSIATQPATQATTQPDARLLRLTNVYNVDRNPFGIFLAAVFGLTPGLLITRLSQNAEQYKQYQNDLQHSERTPIPTSR